MRFDSFLLELIATPLYLFVAFIMCLAICHLLFLKLFPIGVLAWKIVDYVWLSMAALGLIASSSNVDHYISGQLLQSLEIPRTENSYRILRSLVENSADSESGICAERIRSDFSPDDFDDITQEQQLQCSYFGELEAALPSSVTYPFHALEDIGYFQYQGTTRYEKFYIQSLQQYVGEYENQRNLTLSRELATQTSTFEFLMMLLGPLLVCVALALRITKVAVEIRNERSKFS